MRKIKSKKAKNLISANQLIGLKEKIITQTDEHSISHKRNSKYARPYSLNINMDNQMLSLLNNSDIGITLSKMIYNDREKPIDCVISKANRTFDELLEIDSQKNITFKNLEIEPTRIKSLLATINNVLQTGNKQKIELFSPRINKYFSASIIKIERNKFLTIFHDVTENVKSRKRNQRLEKILEIIRQVNQSIVKIDSRQELIDQICEIMIASPLIKHCWLAIRKNEESNYEFISKDIDEPEAITRDYFAKGKTLPCMEKARKLNEPLIIMNKQEECPECPIQDKMQASQYAIMKISHKNNYYGTISLAIDSNFSDCIQEKDLLKEIADDFAFALQNLAIKEKQEQAEKDKSLILNSTQDKICYYDKDHVVQWANNSYLQSGQEALDSVIGQKCLQVRKTGRIWKNCPVQLALKTGKSQQVEITSKDKYHVNLEANNKQWLVNVDPVKNDDGEIIGAIEIASDITMQKKIENSLRKNETKYRSIFNNAHDAIYLHELTEDGLPGSFLDTNKVASEMLGYTKNEFLTMSPKDLNTQKTQPKTPEIMRSLIDDGEVTFKDTHISKDGTHIPVQVRSALIEIDGNTRILSQARDIREKIATEKKNEELQKEIIQTQKLESIGKLAGGVAHDFNNILTVIQGQAQLAKMDLDSSHPLNDELELIMESTSRAADLTRQLLLFSRKQAPLFQSLDLNRTIIGLSKMLKRLISEEIDINLDLSEDLAYIKGDKGQLEQVITNLVVNARDAMDNKGKLSIKTRNHGISNLKNTKINHTDNTNYVCLEIEDNGSGMKEEVLNKIFEPFFTTKQAGAGTGMGLSVVHGIIKNHKGWIDVDSKPGQGTSFKIYLPSTAEQSKNKDNPKQSIKHKTGDNQGILVVEDREPVLNNTVRILNMKNYQTYKAGSGEEALEIFENNKDKISFVLTDIVMPGIRGNELADRLKQIKPSLEIILSSGYTDDKVDKYEIESKGFKFIRKPYSISELMEVIN